MRTTQNLINTFAAEPLTRATSGSTPDAHAADPAAPLPCPPHPHKPYSALVRNSNGGLKIRWFATSAEAVAASRHREFVMDDALAKRLDEMSHMLRAILDRLPAQTASAPVPADQLLESEDAAKLMGYSRANAFIAAARKAGIHHAGTRRRFLWNPADLARWQAAPKEARKWRTLPAIDARAVHRRRAP